MMIILVSKIEQNILLWLYVVLEKFKGECDKKKRFKMNKLFYILLQTHFTYLNLFI